MPRRDDTTSAVITAKWKATLDSENECFGTIKLDNTFRLEFPMLDARDRIPLGTSLLWGLSDQFKRCTALTLPFGPTDYISHPDGDLFFAHGMVTHLFVGPRYIRDPRAEFVTEILFTPQPNGDLHTQQAYKLIEPAKDILEIKFAPTCAQDRTVFATAHIAYFEPERETLFEAVVPGLGITISAWFGKRIAPPSDLSRESIRFSICFQTPRTVGDASEEAFRLCVFLSFISHQSVYPTNFRLLVVGDSEPYELHTRSGRQAVEREHTWVGHTLVLPDQHPTEFCQALQNWYATNDVYVRSRYLYRYSIEEPYTFSPDRFLSIFQAIEGTVRPPGSELLTGSDLAKVEAVVREALPDHPKLEAVLRKFRSNNTESPGDRLKRELPSVLEEANIVARFNIDEFIARVYKRRNKSSHAGSHLDDKPLSDTLISDTLLLTAIYVIVEGHHLGLDPRDVLNKFMGSFNLQLPLATRA